MPEIISCEISNPWLDPYRQLKQPRQSNRFVAEGRLVVERLLRSSYDTESILIAQRRTLWAEQFLEQEGVEFEGPIYAVPDQQIDNLVGFNFHSGILAVGLRNNSDTADPSDRLPQSVNDFENWLATIPKTDQTPQVFAILPHLDLDENLGSIIRSAWALGCCGLIMDHRGADPLGRRTLRVSMGHSLSLPIFRSHDELESLIPILKQQHFKIAAVEVHPNMKPLRETTPADRQALVFGNEFEGVSTTWLQAADEIVGIPMAREVDSLNVAVTVAIVLNHYCVT